jgi:hypothetical protein
MEIRWKLALVALISLSASAAETKWIKLKSPNFEMYTTASERNGRDTLKYFEQVRGFFVQVMMGNIPGKRCQSGLARSIRKKASERNQKIGETDKASPRKRKSIRRNAFRLRQISVSVTEGVSELACAVLAASSTCST